ncbi:hypothetical protein DSCO28_43320 [Desulfosarcina ovata subsp. sediminis]|uniref:Uncharacterized protein n=1 Tax=Desulfosarcina ovata subsp. sediminis TaxID=885957 RepID=A0A5K7ZU59_9BACT|nr:hypothetical protein DSCO28_43320 [Desulfosarcina ovata subsp. sediminis]
MFPSVWQGQKEVQILNIKLNRHFKTEKKVNQVDGYTVERQCPPPPHPPMASVAPTCFTR